MTGNRKLLLVIVAFVAVIGIYWTQVLSPKRAEIAKLDKTLVAAQTDLGETKATLTAYQKAQKGYKANYATVVRLGKAVPEDDDVRSLVVQLSAAAERSDVNFDRIEVGGATATSGGTPTVADPNVKPGPPGSVAVGTAGFSAMPFTLAFDGQFKNLGTFLSRLERFVTVSNDHIEITGRLLRLESISLKAAEAGFPEIRAEIGASSYLLPEGASVTGDDSAVSDGEDAAEADPKTPSTTTAANTGAIR